ncbi:MAG: fold metallo-hydrolase [Frankiales bacterium]|nr:fold metallo-hydrolase [Frankiales bacterium]
MTAIQLAPGVWRVPTTRYDLVNAFLLENSDGSMTVVDAGLRRGSRPILAALGELGKAPQDVTHLLMSHGHLDHAGGASELQQATGSAVWTHDREAVYLREGHPPALDPSLSRLGKLLLTRGPTGFVPVDVAETFADGAVLPLGGGLLVVHTPGHTPGHCSYLHTASGVLLTGDALFNLRRIRYAFAGLCTDVALSRSSAARLGELEFEVAGFTHGPHVSRGAQSAVRAFLAGRTS